MIREIKFRIWDPKADKWFWEPDELGNIIYCDDWDMFDPYDYQFEQFTGLKDMNGKDIYEGDIVKVSDETGSSFVSVVKYFSYDDYPAFDLDPQYIPIDWYFESNILSTLKDDRNEIKVIGNVHNNPELLEEK